MKKGILAAIILNGVLALSIFTYTLVHVFGGEKKKTPYTPTTSTVSLALRVDDTFSFGQGQIVFADLEKENTEVEINSDKTTYTAKNPGEFSAVVTKENGDKITYRVTVFGYGAGTVFDPYNICKADHLFNLEKVSSGEPVSIHDRLDKVFALRADLDLSAYNWNPIGKISGPMSAQLIFNDATEKYSINDQYQTLVRFQYHFTGTFLGNGFTIKNLTINVNQSNFNEFRTIYYVVDDGQPKVQQVDLELGFFGYAYKAKITDLNFENPSITVASALLNDSFAISAEGVDEQVFLKNKRGVAGGRVDFSVKVGTLAGAVVTSQINEGNKKITIKNGNITAFSISTTNGVGGLIGMMRYSTVSNIDISNTTITSNGNDTYAGGLIGNVYQMRRVISVGEQLYYAYTEIDADNDEVMPMIKNCNLVNLTINSKNSENAMAAGITPFVVNANYEDINVLNLKISVLGSKEGEYATAVAGGFVDITSAAHAYETGISEKQVKIKNVHITGEVNAIFEAQNGGALAAGLAVYNNYALIENCSFAGRVRGLLAAGLVYTNYYGQINYTDNFTGKAVDAEIFVFSSGAGLIFRNFGLASGGENNKAKVDVSIKWRRITDGGSYISYGMTGLVGPDLTQNIENASDSYVIAGLVGYLSGTDPLGTVATVENFEVNATIEDPVNGAGFVGFVGRTLEQTIGFYCKFVNFDLDNDGTPEQIIVYGAQTVVLSAGKVQNLTGTVNMKTIESSSPYSTKRAGGAFAVVYSGSEIENVEVKGSVNGHAEANTSTQLSSLYAGGLAAQIFSDSATKGVGISDCVSKVAIRTNVSGFETIDNKRISFTGGLVGLIEQTGAAKIELENCVVEADGDNSFLHNDTGRIVNALVEGQTFDKTVTGVGGIFGFVSSSNAGDLISIKHCSVTGMTITSQFIAAGFAISTKNTEIENCFVDVQSISGKMVLSGFIGGTHGTTTISKSGTKVANLVVPETIEDEMNIAGFVAVGQGTLSVTDAYAYIQNELEFEEGETQIIAAGFVITSGAGVVASFQRCIAYSVIEYGTSRAAPLQRVNSAPEFVPASTSNNYVLAPDTNTDPTMVKFLSEEDMKDLNKFSGFDGDVWEVLENALFPTIK